MNVPVLRTRFAVPVSLALILVVATAGGALANRPLLQVSSDPYTNASSQHKTEVEPDTFAFGSTLVEASQVGRFFDGGSSNIGFAISTNAGRSFTNGFLPGTTEFATPSGPYRRVSDPSVAYDAAHNVWLISYLGLFPAGGAAVDVLVSRSTDGGSTWGNPVIIAATGHSLDKNLTTCDNTSTSPFYGRCYTEFDDNSLGNLVEMSTSSDGGRTWGIPQAPSNKPFGIGGQPVVQPNGRVIVPFVGFTGAGFLLMVMLSNDGGASWTSDGIAAPMRFHNPAGGIRADIPMPSAEVDAAGRVYVVWSDCRFEPRCSASDLVMSTTTDGRVWTRPTRIPTDPVGNGVDHFIPGLAVDRSSSGATARLALTYYFYPDANCTSATCQLSVGYTVSNDGGASWTTGTRVAGPMLLSWLPDTTQGRMVGDYISTSFAGTAFPAVAVANPPAGATFDEAIYTVSGGLPVAARTVAATDQSDAPMIGQPTSSNRTVR
jgi:hypothetical protein